MDPETDPREVEEDSDLEEWDDDEAHAPPRKKQRSDTRGANFFLDTEVSESDEEDEGYEDTNDVISRIRQESQRRGPSMADLTAEQLNQTAARFARYDMEEEEDDVGAGRGVQRRRLPTVKDPRIWKIACKSGEERRVVAAIMNRCVEREMIRKPLKIYSAFCTDHVTGYIFVEARHSDDVKTAIEGILSFSSRLPFTSRPEAIKLSEMPSVLKVPKSSTTLGKGSWVRIKRGLYKNDLAQVHRVDESDNNLWIKIIPRLDLTPDTEEAGDKRRRRRNSQRPAANFFSRDEIIASDMDMDLQQDYRDAVLGETFDLFKKKKYKDGFLYKLMKIQSLDINVTPTLEELKRFRRGSGEDGQADTVSLSRKANQKNFSFAKGDTVEVISGNTKSLKGVVKSVTADRVVMMPLLDNYNQPVEVEISNLRKYFRKGDHVKVTGGRYKGQSGLITNTDGDVVSIYSNAANDTYKVLIQDIQECSSSSTERVQLGKYKLHDLVTIGQTSVGVIVKIGMDDFSVLDTTGIVKKVSLSEMGQKRRSNVSFDKLQNQITANDEVTVVEGNYKGKEGTIKYVHRHHVFIQARGLAENGGMFVCRSSFVVANGRAGGAPRGHQMNSFAPRSPFIGGDRGRGGSRGGRGGRGGRGRGRRDPMIGKKVKITKGAFKGYDAIVRECNDSNFRVELTSKSKIISVANDAIKIPEDNTGGSYDRYAGLHSGRTPMLGDRTPMLGDRTPMLGDRTPMLGDRTPMLGDRTPMLGDRTPMRSDNTTPYNDDRDWAAPRDYSHDRNEPDYSLVTPSFDTVSPYGQIGTPGDMSYPSTPGTFSIDTPAYGQATESPYATATPQAYPSTPATPGMMNPQTPGFGEPYETSNYDDMSDSLPSKIEVRIKDNYSAGSTFTGKLGVILESGSTPQVKLYSGQITYVPVNCLEPTVPAKKDRVKVVFGENKNAAGTLSSVNNNEAVVMTDTGDVIMVPMSHLGKFVQ